MIRLWKKQRNLFKQISFYMKIAGPRGPAIIFENSFCKQKNARPMNVFLGGVNYVSKIILTINYNIDHNP